MQTSLILIQKVCLPFAITPETYKRILTYKGAILSARGSYVNNHAKSSRVKAFLRDIFVSILTVAGTQYTNLPAYTVNFINNSIVSLTDAKYV